MFIQVIFSLFLSAGIHPTWSQPNQDFVEYVERYADIAVREMERAGIPASIKLAQGILESDAGKSWLARQANNHFGIKCGNDWQGKTLMKKDDDYDDKGQLVESCFRVYKNVEASYVAHSEFLRDPRKNFRYGFLFRLDPTDYRRWAQGLKDAGYATSATYPTKLIDLIERYELYKYDTQSTIDVDTPIDVITESGGILKNNDVSYIVATGGETVADIARRTDVAARNLIKYNEHLSTEQQKLDEGERVYIQPKRDSYRGRQQYHVVESGETMFTISQRYAVQVSELYERNRLEPGQQPAPGERIKLRGGRVKKAPRLSTQQLEKLDPTPKVEPITDPVTGELEMDDSGTITAEPKKTAEPTWTWPQQSPDKQQPTTTSPTTKPTTTTTGGSQVRTESPGIIITKPSSGQSPQPTKPTTTEPSPTTGAGAVNEDPFGNNPRPMPPSPTSERPTEQPTATPVYHTVQTGDTLWNISQRYGASVDDIRRLNGLNDNTIKIGARLRVK